MAQSVKFADDTLVDDARAAAELQSRSLAGQIAYWARIGRAVERSGTFDHVRLSRVLAGEFETTVLSPSEKAVWSERFLAKVSEAGPDEDAFFAELRAGGKAVGLNPSGRIVYAAVQPDQ